MRVMVKRLLKKYHYPPEGQEQALQTVMAQCNRWADDESNYYQIDNSRYEEPKVKGKAVNVRLIPEGSMLTEILPDTDENRLINNMMALDEGTTILTIVAECQKEFQEKYFSMKQRDWLHLIRDYVRNATKKPDLQDNEVFTFKMAG